MTSLHCLTLTMITEVKNLAELRALEINVFAHAHATAQSLVQSAERGIALLKKLKFERAGLHPLRGTPLNLIEQINQSFTCLVTFEAVRLLFQWHQNKCAGFKLHIGTASGSDIESIEPGFIAAELFAAVSTGNNKKLSKDIAKVAAVPAQHRYVFFHSPAINPGTEPRRLTDREPAGGSVEVWSIGVAEN